MISLLGSFQQNLFLTNWLTRIYLRDLKNMTTILKFRFSYIVKNNLLYTFFFIYVFCMCFSIFRLYLCCGHTFVFILGSRTRRWICWAVIVHEVSTEESILSLCNQFMDFLLIKVPIIQIVQSFARTCEIVTHIFFKFFCVNLDTNQSCVRICHSRTMYMQVCQSVRVWYTYFVKIYHTEKSQT